MRFKPLGMNGFVMTLIGLAGFTVLSGRFFCGYVCAFGTLGDAVYGLSGLVQKKVLGRKKQISIPDKAVPVLQKIKYILLLLIVILCAAGIYGSLNGYSPWDVFGECVVCNSQKLIVSHLCCALHIIIYLNQ